MAPVTSSSGPVGVNNNNNTATNNHSNNRSGTPSQQLDNRQQSSQQQPMGISSSGQPLPVGVVNGNGGEYEEERRGNRFLDFLCCRVH